MKVSTAREALLFASTLAERVTGKRESLPVLSCIVLDASGKGLVLRATNLEAGIEVSVPASVESPGVIAAPASVFRETVRGGAGESIALKEADGNLSVESRGSKNLIKAIPHEEFPVLTGKGGKGGSLVARARLTEALSSVLYAASPSMIRPELGSVYLSLSQGALVAAATDSFRLAEKTARGAVKKSDGDILIPLKHAQELLFILERMADEEVSLAESDTQLSVSGESVRFVSRVVDAQFPAYKEIIPKKLSTEATLLKSDFAEVLRKARVFSGDEQHVGFHVYPKRKIFTVTARSADIGEMSDSIDAALSGEDIDINFHIGYLADCLPAVASDSITLGFAGAGKPLLITSVSDASFLYLAMPLNR